MPSKSNTQSWDKDYWTKQARSLIDNLDKFPAQSKITIIMRHSQRNEPKLVKESDLEGANMELTPLGEEIAKIFGNYLPKNRAVRLFHSPRSRCKVTAEKIYQGFIELNGKGQFIGECKALYGIGINGQSYLDEFTHVEGIVIDDNVTLCDFIGLLSEFYLILGFKKIIKLS